MSELRQQLKSAREWLRVLIEQFDIEPSDTVITVSARGPDRNETVAEISLAESLTHIDAALKEASDV